MKMINIVFGSTSIVCVMLLAPGLCYAQNELSSGSGGILSDQTYSDMATDEENETVTVIIQYPSGAMEAVEVYEEDAAVLYDLQNAMQRQQQTLQTMSNISKILHDTAMAVIRKIG